MGRKKYTLEERKALTDNMRKNCWVKCECGHAKQNHKPPEHGRCFCCSCLKFKERDKTEE